MAGEFRGEASKLLYPVDYSVNEYSFFEAGGCRATRVASTFVRRTWPGPEGSNLTLDVRRSERCGYEYGFQRGLEKLDVDPR